MDFATFGPLEGFRQALSSWTDERFVSRDDVWALAVFGTYLVNLADGDGWQYRGHSFRVKDPMCTLVVRAYIDDIPHVVFSSGRTYTACIRAFLRKLEGGYLDWVVDRYG